MFVLSACRVVANGMIFSMFKKLMKSLFQISVSKFTPNPLESSQIGLGAKISDDVEFSGYLKNIRIGAKVSINKHVNLSCHDSDSYLDIGEAFALVKTAVSTHFVFYMGMADWRLAIM